MTQEGSEPALDHVLPEEICGDEVEARARMAGHPLPHLLTAARVAVVEVQVHGLRGEAADQLVREFLVSMPSAAGATDLPGEHFHGHRQGQDPAPSNSVHVLQSLVTGLLVGRMHDCSQVAAALLHTG